MEETNESNDLTLINRPLQTFKSSTENEFPTTFKRKANFTLTGALFKNQRLNKIFTKTARTSHVKPKVERASIVYQLPHIGDMKFKDYDKISGDIKKLENTIRKEKEMFWKKLSSKTNSNNFNDIDGSYSSEENSIDNGLKNNKYIDKYNILEVIQKFKIPPENRTVEDLYITKNFLHQTKLAEHYMQEFNNDKRMVENVTTFFGLEFRYQKYKKGETIYRIDDYSDNFYMVLLGKVDILNVEPKMVKITGYDYFCYIMNLKKNNEMHRYKLCVEENMDIFPIFSDEEDLLPFIFLQFVLEDIKEGKKIDFQGILDLIDIKPKDLGLVENKLNSVEYILEKEKKITKKIINFSNEKIKEYRFINNKIVKRNLKLFEYVPIKTIDPLNFFGDESIESNSPRTETAVCVEQTELIYIMNKLYINNILPKKSMILEKKTAFLGKNYLFNKIVPKKFVKRYFNFFSLDTYDKGDILFEENTELKYVYFIKEGNINLFTSKSILEMEMFINEINKKIKIVQNIFNNGDNTDEEKNLILYNNIKSSSAELLEHIIKREKIKIFTLKDNEDIGLVSYLLGLGHLVTGIVESPQALIYKIKKDDFTEILKREKLSFYELINRVEDKLKIFSDRFYEINNIKLSMADQKIVLENNIKYNLSNKNANELSLDNFPMKNKPKADVDKIKEIINDHDFNQYQLLRKTYKNRNIMLTLPSLYNKYINNNMSISPKKMRDIKNIKANFNKNKTKGSNTKSNNKRKKMQFKSFFPEENKKRPKATIRERVKKLLYYKKNFPYEEELLTKLTEDMNNLLENKLILTKKAKINDTNELSSNKDNESMDNIDNDEIKKTETNNLIRDKYNSLLITQIENINHKIRANHFFSNTEHKFNKRNTDINLSNNILNNTKNILLLNAYKDKFLSKSNNQRISTINHYSTNITLFDNEKTIPTIFQKTDKTRNIKHPYISPLTMIKLKRYKMIDEKDQFKENKKRYENKVIKGFKERGLNQFGFPISYDKTLLRKYNYNKIKK